MSSVDRQNICSFALLLLMLRAQIVPHCHQCICPRGGGGHSLIWPKWVCASEQGMVFRVLNLNSLYNLSIQCLEQGAFWPGSI